ncbi:MAG: DUF167 domain-containing protein [Verrucomicrobiae bacterium]
MAAGISCRLGIKAVPNASRDQIAGWLGDDLKVRVQSPPEDGRANKRLCHFLAAQLDLPKGAVSVVSGQSSQRKTVEIRGLSLAELKKRWPDQGAASDLHGT